MKLIKETLHYLLDNKLLFIVIIPALVLTLMPLVFDGQNGCVNGKCGFIVGTNYRDGIWFQAVAATSFKTFPFQMPNFSGEILRGYHYLPNLFAYLLSFVGIPIAFTFYKIIPIFYISTLTLLTINLGKKIHNSPFFVGILLFFMYFGMHLSLITSLFHFGKLRNQALINTFQATRILESPHTALALLILFSILIILYKKTVNVKSRIIISILTFLSFGIKFYIAFSIVNILFFYEVVEFIKTKKIKNFFVNNFVYAIGVVFAIFLFYDPLNSLNSGSIFMFSPFATVHHLIESPDLFYLPQMVLARYYLYEHGWSSRLIFIEFFSSFLFVLFYFGTRIIGFIQICLQLIKKNINAVELAISFSLVSSIIFSIMLIQKGDWFNPIQFAVPAAFLTNIFAAKFIFRIIKRSKILGYLLLTVVILITFPANLSNISYLSNTGRLVIPQKEMDALNFLKKQPEGTVFAPIDENDMAYVSAFTGKPTYINFISVLENAGINFKNRYELSKKNSFEQIKSQNIKYLYLNGVMKSECNNSKKESIIFKNDLISICKLNSN